MKKIVEVLKNRIVISIIGLILLSLVIWFAGPLIKFGDNNTAPLQGAVTRLILILIVVVLWGLNNLRIQMSNSKKDRELLSGLQGGMNDPAIDHASAQSQEELAQINDTFTRALETVKKIKFSKDGRRRPLYELPWYILIGPPGAGKTTALINSTLEFPLAEQFGKGAVKGVGGTRNCDWWFTNEAVLIDTAGRYTTQDSHKVADSAVWSGFLELLRKKRRRRPINGVIVAISLQEIMTQTEAERSEHAKIIRSRIDELMERLGIRIPIYLLLTKSDLVAGFSEFFEDLNREEREQVWGISLPASSDPTQSPDFELIDREYGGLVERLNERVLARIHHERDVRRRGAIFAFPQQMEGLGPAIQSFVRQLFVKNRYQFQPYMRGLYFCSGTQDGTPIDRLMSQVSNSFGIPRASVQPSQAQGKSFFLGDLFRAVIFPEAELVGTNKRYERLSTWSRRAAYAGGVVVVAGISLGWLGSYTQHTQNLQQVQSQLDTFKAEQGKLSQVPHDLAGALPALNALHQASTVYDQERHPWLSGFGLYDPEVDRSADAAYRAQLQALYLPRLTGYIEKELKSGLEGKELYNTFRIYMMFGKLDHMDRKVVSDWFMAAWERDFNHQEELRGQLGQHLAALFGTELQPAALDRPLVDAVRSQVLRVPVSQRIYSSIRNNPENARTVDMLNLFGEPARHAFVINARVQNAAATPFMFTLEGYKNIDISPGSGVVKAIQDDSWVLYDDAAARPEFSKAELEEISEKVREHYLADYLNHWRRLYDSLELVHFRDVTHANDVLTKMADPVSSPLLTVLQQGAINTQLSSTPLDGLAGKIPGDKGDKLNKAAALAASFTEPTIVDKQFQSINQLTKGPQGQPAPIDAALQRVMQLQEMVKELAGAPEPAKQAFEMMKGRYQSGEGGAIAALQLHAKGMPQPVRGWLESMADQSWKVVLGSSGQHLAAEWRAQVYTPYAKALAGRYPLAPGARDEVAVADFSEFFKPGGTVDQFFNEHLKSFVDTRGQWKNKSVNGRSLGLSASALAALTRANEIKNVFFRGGAEQPGLSFQLRPLQMDKNDARFTFELGKQSLSYSHGPKLWRPMQWQGSGEYGRAQAIFEGLNGQTSSRIYEGSWVWFRLQDENPIVKTAQPNIYRIDFSAPGSAGGGERRISFEIKADSVNNPFGRDLLGTFRVPETI